MPSFRLFRYLLLTLLPLLAWGLPTHPPCLRLTGVVQDISTHQPLSARLSVRATGGPTLQGQSTDGTGQFAIDLACSATVLLVERTGYRPQRLPLNVQALPAADEIYVVIPLVAVDQQGTDRPYLQTEQKHYVQAGGNGGGAVQHNRFAVADALTGVGLRAQACFFFTKTGQKTCIDTDGAGQCSTDFSEKDIVAVEVQSPGYQTYQGNISVEQLGGPARQHTIQLLRSLTILSVQCSPVRAGQGLQALLRPESGKTPVPLTAAADKPGAFATASLLPSRYELLLLDGRRTVVHRQPVTLSAGLNVQLVTLPESASRAAETASPVARRRATTPPASVTVAPAPVLVLTDNLPRLFFEESSYLLSDEARIVLNQVGRYLQQHPDVSLQLTGHTDRLGDERLNKSLGEYRAKVAAGHLHWQWGIADDRLSISGFGSRFLIGANNTDESRRLNRRVSLKFVPTASLTSTAVPLRP